MADRRDSPLRRGYDYSIVTPELLTEDVHRATFGDTTQGGLVNEAAKGLRRYTDSRATGSLAEQALDAELAGNTSEVDRLMAERALRLNTSAPDAPRVGGFTDIGSVGDAVDWAGSTFGEGVPSLIPTIAGAAAGRFGLGRLIGSAPAAAMGAAVPAYGDIRRGEIGAQYDDPALAATSAEDRSRTATQTAALGTGLEVLLPTRIVGGMGRGVGGIARRRLDDAATEAITEGGQDVISQVGQMGLDPSREFSTSSVVDATAAGALVGGAAGTLGRPTQDTIDDVRGAASGAAARVAGAAARVAGAMPSSSAKPPVDLNASAYEAADAADPSTPNHMGQAQRTKDYVSDTIDRMGEASKTAQTPDEFLRQVFGNSSEEAAADLRPDIEDPGVMNSADPAAALQQRDAERQQRAARFAEELLSDPATPDAIKERVASFGGDFTNPEAQAFVARNLVSQRAGEKIAHAVSDLIDLSKDFGGKAAEVGTDLAAKARDMVDEGMTAAADRIVKKNLQDATPAEQATFNKLIFDSLTDEAKANPTVRQRLPEIANAMLAFAARTGDLTKADLKTLSRIQDGMAMFRDPEQLAAHLTEYAGLPRTEDSFLSRIKRVTNAQQDIRQPNSFLYSSLTEEAKDSLSQPQLRQLARLVDEFTLSDASKAQGDKVLAGLTAAFGSKDAASSVLDYYQQQNRADVRFDPNEMLTEGGTTERDSAPAPTYQFADAKAMRPYRAFAGQMSSEGGMRRRLRESTIAGAALRRSSPGGARVRPVKMSQYVADTGGNPETEVKRIAADIKDRIDQHKARKGEDRSQQINQLQGELTLMRQAYKDGGAQAALDLYEVLQVSEQEQNDTIATDADIAKMATLADAKDAKETRVTFQREDGSKFTLSAESMWKTLGDKEGSGKGENAQARAKRLFADAAASVLARPEVAKMVTPMEKILIDRKLGVRAKKKGNPEYRAMVADALKAAEGSIKSLQTTLDNVVDEYLEAADNEAKSEEYGSRREEIEAIIDQNITQLSERLDAAREGKGPMAGNMPAQAVARQKLRMYRDAQSQIDAAKFDEEFDERDNNRSGVPGADESGPMGPNGLPRTRMNEELGNTGTRYSEEDTGLGVGVEKRGPKSETSRGKVVKKSFVGEKADPEGAAEASKALDSGAAAGLVWAMHGWFRGPDGKMRKELRSPELRAQVREFAKHLLGQRTGTVGAGSGSVSADQLFDGVPGYEKLLGPLGKYTIDLEDSPEVGLNGMVGVVSGSTLTMSVDGAALQAVMRKYTADELAPLADDGVLDPADMFASTYDAISWGSLPKFKSVEAFEEAVLAEMEKGIHHELQHILQDVEGFENGSNSTLAIVSKYGDISVLEEARKNDDLPTILAEVERARSAMLADIGPDADPEAVAYSLYRDIMGEVEAHDVEARFNLSDAEAKRILPELMNPNPEFLRGVGIAVDSAKLTEKLHRASKVGGRRGRPGKNWGDKASVKAEILRLRGKDVKVRIEKLVRDLGGSGQYTYDPATGERLIEVAVNARSPVGTARHEAMHDLFRFLSENDATRSVAKDLRDATSAPHVIRQLRELLKDRKAALEQLSDPEERAAYAYQFWAEGLLQIGPTGTGVFNTIRQFIKDLFGIVTAGQRGEDLLRAFHDGKFADPSTVQEVLQDINDSSGDRVANKLNRAAPALTRALNSLVSAAPERLRRFENDYLNELADKFQPENGTGFVQNKYQQEGVWKNRLGGILRGTTAVERREAIDQLQSMNPTSKLAKELAKFNEDIYEYMRDAGVQSWDSATKKFVPLRKVQGYFTRSWDPDAIARNRPEFEALLRTEGGVSAANAAALVENLVRGSEQRPGPKESPVDLGFMPYAPHTSERVLTFINSGNADKFAKFQRKDLADIMMSYVRGSTHRAEYAREFGNNGEKIVDLVAKSGIKDTKELGEISNAVQALEGSLDPGNWSVQTKEAMSALMTLQNVTLLPLALVSQMIDPIVLAARTGDIKDAGTAYVTALKRLKNTIAKSKNKVPGEELAEILGVVSEDSTLQAMAVAYGTTRMSKRMENINRVFFKYNGMQGWNDSMRIAATAAGEKYLLAHKGDAKALAELGLEPKDIKSVGGKLDVSSPKVQQAMFQFVDQAVLRPSAANRPVWMSDPRFLLVAHLKQFTFAMHNVVLKRANRELQNDNPKPWGILMLAMPVILAADVAKFVLTGRVPAGWGFKDYVMHAVERSGLMGISEFGVQAMDRVGSGKMPGEGLLGPTFEHLMEILRWIGGDPRTSFGDVIDRTVPGSRYI